MPTSEFKDNIATKLDEFCAAINSELEMSNAPESTKSLVEEVIHRMFESFASIIDDIVNKLP